MFFSWLKRYLPKGLYWRAALILLLPIILLQIVVSVAFIQRYFEDVTTQMTANMLRELNLVLRVIDSAPDQNSARSTIFQDVTELGLGIKFVDENPSSDQIRWFDFSGLVFTRTLRQELPNLQAITLPDNREVILNFETTHGPVQMQFERSRVSATNPHQLLVIMVLFGALMTIIAYLYLRNQLRSITALADAAQAFGRGRNVTYEPRGALEIRAAGQAFLDMRDRIQRHMEQRTLMLSGVSHDLRTPLTRLKLGLSFIEHNEAEPLLQDVEAMERLIDEFLSFIKGAKEEEPELIDPKNLVETVVTDAQRLGFDVNIGEINGRGEVHLRAGAFRRALENLISNGVRYGSRVEVSLEVTDKSLLFRIEDNGPGIPKERREEAVAPFTRLDPSRNQDKGSGVGLGLAITREIAYGNGGILELSKSQRLGGLQADILVQRDSNG
ncbi:MAG: ATP-binding protein [Aestuariivita sp.]|nr:ATP-binding protein [Aestuariivita sp.]MCY4200996.1 ATP-binding protein [Aestuariivita sp.]